MLSKALELASVSIRAPLLGKMEGHYFLRAYEIKRYFNIYMFNIYIYIYSIYIYIYMPCKQVSLSIGARMGNLKEIRLPRRSYRKGKVYLGSFPGPRGH